MMQNIASQRYSSALFELGKKQNKIELFLNQLKDISWILSHNAELFEFINHPDIGIHEKNKVLKNVFGDRVEDELVELMFLLNEHGRLNEINSVYDSYEKLVLKYKGIKVAHVTTAVKMTDDEIEALKNKLSMKYNSKIIIKNKLDKEIIGGVYIRIEDEVIDGTIRGRLDMIKKHLMQEDGEVSI